MAKVKIDFVGNTSQLKKSISDVQNQIGGLNKSASKGFGGVLTGGIAGGIAGAGVSIITNAVSSLTRALSQAAGAMVGFGQSSVVSKANMETMTLQIKQLLDNRGNISTLMKDLTRLASETPLSISDLATNLKTLLAYGVDEGGALDTLRMLGDIAQGDAEKLRNLSFIYGKVMSAGFMDTEAYNRMTELGIPVRQKLAEKYEGQDVRKMLERREISSDTVNEIFKGLVSEGGKFQGSMAEISTTFNGLVSTMNDAIESLKRTFITDELFATIKETIRSLTTTLNQFKDPLAQIGNSLNDFVKSTLPDVLEGLSNLAILLNKGKLGEYTRAKTAEWIKGNIFEEAGSNPISNQNKMFWDSVKAVYGMFTMDESGKILSDAKPVVIAIPDGMETQPAQGQFGSEAARLKWAAKIAARKLSPDNILNWIELQSNMRSEPLDYFGINDLLYNIGNYVDKDETEKKGLDKYRPFLDSLQSIGGGKIFGGVSPIDIARDSLTELKKIARNTASPNWAVAG